MRLGNKCKQWAIAALVMSLLLTGCSANENQNDLNDAVDAETVISENIADGQQEEPAEDVSDSQPVVLADDREIVCENPYFFPQDVSSMTADITYQEFESFVPIKGELELHWIKQYDNGCLARLSVVPFEYDTEMVNYLGVSHFNMYFYVTSEEIYHVDFFVSDVDKPFDDMDAYINHNDELVMSILNTDEKLMEHGELVFSLERIQNDVPEGEAGTWLSISQEGDQVLYSRAETSGYNIGNWENFIWENGLGLVRYRKAFRAERDPFYIENIVFND